MDHEYDVLGGYLPSFVEHLRDTSARLGLGGAVEGVPDTRTHSNSWTSTERDAFFRGLSVHSRWRPDLIAACIPTKAIWEVWMYLEALEEGAAALGAREESDDVDMEGSDERRDADASASGSGSDTEDDEAWCEPALEVSQAWIDVEERMASWIVQQERLGSVGEDADADTEGESRKRKRGRSRCAGKGRGRTVSSEGRSSLAGDHHSPSLGSPSASARCLSVSPTRKREALMGRLEISHLLTLDSILREGEEAAKEKGKSREDSVTHGDEHQAHVDVQHLSSTQGTRNAPDAASDMVIDPVLLALSGNPVGQVCGETTSRRRTPDPGPSSLPDIASQQTLPAACSQPGAGTTFVFAPVDTTHADPDPPENVDSDLSVLSPRSRRRAQKRLYMRRKRATDGAVDTGVQKLKPGKKAKRQVAARVERSETPAVTRSVLGSEGPSDDEVEPAGDAPRKNKGGLTLPYKLKAQFGELGIDAAYLRSQGMDLLNLGALGRLMGLHASLELGEEERDIAESIDAQLIRHLQAAMVSWVTDLTHRAVVWREREIRLKQRSQAWRQGDQITVGAIEHAIEAVGARYRSHKEYFKALEVFHGLSTPGKDAEEPSPADRHVEATARRETCTPLIRPPATWGMDPLACLSRTYEREATRTRRGPSTDPDEDALGSDETDEETLAAGLAAEAAADEADREAGEREEGRLWENN